MPTILLTGGTGMIGTHLQNFLLEKGYKIIVLIRNEKQKKHSDKNISYAKWNVEKGEIDKTRLHNSDYIIHLAGANVAEKRWTDKRKKKLLKAEQKAANC